MSSNETTAGCEMALTAAPGEPARLDEGLDIAQAVLRAISNACFPTFDDMRAV
jgi:hypothetical protein